MEQLKLETIGQMSRSTTDSQATLVKAKAEKPPATQLNIGLRATAKRPTSSGVASKSKEPANKKPRGGTPTLEKVSVQKK